MSSFSINFKKSSSDLQSVDIWINLLSGFPKSSKPVSQDFQDIGYYKDEKGYTRFGIIPKKVQQRVFATWDNYDGRNLTSNPKYRWII